MSDARLIPFADAKRVVWGNPGKGYILDWFYAQNENISTNIFQLAPGEYGGHAPGEPAVFGADMVMTVLEGEAIFVNPQTGENVRACVGETVYIEKETWNNVFNVGDGVLTCIEWFHPSPLLGTGSAYAKQFPDLEVEKFAQDEYIGAWPARRAEAAAAQSIRLVREQDYLWRMEGANTFHVGIIASNENATLGRVFVRAGVRTASVTRPSDTGLYVQEGHLIVELPAEKTFLDIGAKDGAYIPAGTEHRFYNPTGAQVSAFFTTAPAYL